MARTRLLITAFGPFPGVPVNPTARLAQALASDRRLQRAGIAAQALVMRTAYADIGATLLPALSAQAPDAVLMLGVAARRRAITPEARAANRASLFFHDRAGRLPAALALRPHGPAHLKPPLPLAPLVVAMKAGGARIRLSRNAGRYLCNAAYFAALESGARTRSCTIVFIHVPMPSEGGRGRAPMQRRSRPGSHAEVSFASMKRALLVAALHLSRESRRRRYNQQMVSQPEPSVTAR